MRKTIWQETKEMLKWFWKMTTLRNIAANLLFFGILVVTALFLIGAVLFVREGCMYVVSLYQQSGPGDKLATITGVGGVFLGVAISGVGGFIKRKLNQD